VLDVINNYLALGGCRDVRLLFDALKFVSSLLIHRKFAWEFIAAQGVEKLLRVNRLSMASTGVATCLYYLAYSKDIMEKVCHLSDSVLSEMVDYALWLLDYSYESGRSAAAMFFVYALQFRTVLQRFDQRDGMRRMFNYISTLTILQQTDEGLDDEVSDEHMQQSQATVKNALGAFHSYLSSRLFLKMEHLAKHSQKYGSQSLSGDDNVPFPSSFPTSRGHHKTEVR